MRKLIITIVSLCLAVSFSVGPFVSADKTGTGLAAESPVTASTADTAQQENSQAADAEEPVSVSQKTDIGNHLDNGSFNRGTDSFKTTSTGTYNVVTEANGNLYASVTFDSIYRVFTSNQTSLKSGVSYVLSFDYYIPADNSNQFVYGLSTVAGHPTSAQQIKPNGYAPFTLTNRDTGAVVISSTTTKTNASMIHYGSGTRTVAVDGVSRGNNGETGSWMHFEMPFTLTSNAPSVYFYFMSYEQGVVNGTTLPYVANKTVNFDNVLIKGVYTPSVSAEAGGKAQMEIIDTISTPGKVNEGGRVKFTAVPSYLNGFKGWKNSSGAIVSTEPVYTARLSENTALTATFSGYNNIKTYGAEYGMTEEGIDSSTTATYAAVSNASGISSLGSSLTKISGSSVNRYFRYNKMTLQRNTSYTLSFYLYNTGTSCSFGVFRDAGFSSAVASSATLTGYSVSSSGESSLGASVLPGSVYTPTSSDQWTHYTLSFNTADYTGSAYFAVRFDGAPSLGGYLYIDNVSLANTGVVTVIPGAGGTVASVQFGGTVTKSTGKGFQYGTYINLTATADVGKNFLAWTDENNTPISYDISYTFCVNGSVTLRPLFDTGNEIYNGNFIRGTDGWKTYGDSASGVAMSVLSNDDLEAANIPRTPSGSPALKLSYSRTDTALNKRVQAYSTYTMKTENYTTYVVSTWVYTAYANARISFYVPTASIPYQYDATNDFSYVYGGYNIGATQLSGTYKYLLNDKQQSSTGMFSTNTDYYRSFDSANNVNGWTKVSFIFTTDGNANCVKNATVSVGIKSYNDGAINYTAGNAYFTDITVKKYSDYHIKNNVKGGNVTVNDKVVLSSLDCTAQFGDLVKLNADTYSGFLFNGWYKDEEAAPFTEQEDVDLLYTGSATYTARYRYDPSATNFMLDDFESLLEPSEVPATSSDGDINGDGLSDLKDVTSLSRYVAGWQGIVVTLSKLDLTGDGIIDLRDITYLSRLIAGWDLTGSSTGNISSVWKLLAEGGGSVQTGDSLAWGSYNVTDGAEFTAKPHGGNNMLAVYGRGNYSERLIDVKANTDYLLTFYWYQKSGVSNKLNSVAITANTSSIKVGSQAEYADSSLTGSFMAQNYTPVATNGSWQKYTLVFNSKTNTQLKLFLKYSADTSTGADYLFLDDFSLLPLNTETSSGSVTSLSVLNNTAPLNNTFTGISATVYHCYTFMDDARGRNYTDEMAALEMDRLRDTGTKLVRTIFKSWFAWDDSKGTWNWESQRMQDSYRWALELQKRGINIALNASWSLGYMVDGTSSIPEVPYLYANGDYNLACARYGEWMKQALQAFEAHGVHNITHLIVFTEPSRWTADQLEGPQAAQWVQACNALDTALRSAGIRNKYKLVGPNQGSVTTGEGLLNYALQHCDSAVDIYSTHFYPRSTNATDDAYGSQTAAAYKSYMDVMKRNNSVKDFWADEYFAAATNAPLGTDSAWIGTQVAVGMTSAMNAGMEGMLSWQLFDQLWVDQTNTGGEFTDGIHVCGTAPSLFTSAVPRSQYYALTLLSKYFGYKNGQAFTSTAPAGNGLYVSCAKLEDGSYTVMVVNAGSSDKKVQVNFGQALNQTLYRHLYDPDTIKPDARAKVLPADKVYTSVGTSLVDTVPSGGIAIYTGLGY